MGLMLRPGTPRTETSGDPLARACSVSDGDSNCGGGGESSTERLAGYAEGRGS